ncbi:MAG: hypothetical protein AVDCRST_MAG27-871 [uncultured Craurococcus sp.]|uniref:Uncharacterized protein n=1 Tax=uncultured Craurococcus sp. TaxID=1135998 RepID=A0A6J4HQR6_9PROT|nr:MAG: hypothetical protein AVDCRST_MAG27-871 [uncultured Craurococcus sp.]
MMTPVVTETRADDHPARRPAGAAPARGRADRAYPPPGRLG